MARRRESDISVWRVVLGLLIEEPGHGYDLARRVSERFAATDYAQSAIYKELRKLEREGLVHVVGETQRAQAGGGGSTAAHPPRTCYEATQDGERRFREWLLASPSAPMMREEMHLRISLCQPRDLPRLIELVRAEETVCLALVDELQRRRNRAGPAHTQGWAGRMALAADHMEAGFWDGRIKWLASVGVFLEQELAGVECSRRGTR